jgi:hypothetical protein
MPAGLTVEAGPKEGGAGLGTSGMVGGTSLTKGCGGLLLLLKLLVIDVKMGGFLEGRELNL